MKRTQNILFLSVLILCMVAGDVFAAFQYVQAPPFTKVIKGAVKNVSTKTPLQVPVITWGGDMATILANGNARDTVDGSIFASDGLKIKIVREDDFSKQVEAYVRGDSPFLRGTMGMINMAVEKLSEDPRTTPVVVYQMTWSAGGDALVVKDTIKTPTDLCGKTVALQAYGPHVDYLTKIIGDACSSPTDVKIKWTKDLVGISETTPGGALRSDPSIDAAMVISPDALALTSGGTVGTGAEDSVRGAHILFSTKTADHIIADVYAVRADYLEQHRDTVEKFVHGLMKGQERLRDIVRNKEASPADYQRMISASADILLDSSQAVADAEGLYADCRYVGYPGNVKFFGDPNEPRNFDRLTQEIQTAFMGIGMLSGKKTLPHAFWDYSVFQAGLSDTQNVQVPRFNQNTINQIIQKKQQQGTLKEGELFSFKVYFEPNQDDFSSDMYADQFDTVIEKAATYGGAVITVEGNSDPMGYLKKKKEGESEIVLSQIKQAAKNLSLTRADAVRDAIIAHAQTKHISLNPSQFTTIGHGIMNPENGMCGSDPCAPKTKQEWLNNMRVVFRIIQIEAESDTFEPLN